MFNKDEVQSNIKDFRTYLYNSQWAYEDTKPEEKNLDQAIRISLSNVRLFKDSLVKIIGDIFDSYDSLINLFGGQCQII